MVEPENHCKNTNMVVTLPKSPSGSINNTVKVKKSKLEKLITDKDQSTMER